MKGFVPIDKDYVNSPLLEGIEYSEVVLSAFQNIQLLVLMQLKESAQQVQFAILSA